DVRNQAVEVGDLFGRNRRQLRHVDHFRVPADDLDDRLPWNFDLLFPGRFHTAGLLFLHEPGARQLVAAGQPKDLIRALPGARRGMRREDDRLYAFEFDRSDLPFVLDLQTAFTEPFDPAADLGQTAVARHDQREILVAGLGKLLFIFR